jgi:hypothetical protein
MESVSVKRCAEFEVVHMYYEVGVSHKGGGAGADLGARSCQSTSREMVLFFS